MCRKDASLLQFLCDSVRKYVKWFKRVHQPMATLLTAVALEIFNEDFARNNAKAERALRPLAPFLIFGLQSPHLEDLFGCSLTIACHLLCTLAHDHVVSPVKLALTAARHVRNHSTGEGDFLDGSLSGSSTTQQVLAYVELIFYQFFHADLLTAAADKGMRNVMLLFPDALLQQYCSATGSRSAMENSPSTLLQLWCLCQMTSCTSSTSTPSRGGAAPFPAVQKLLKTANHLEVRALSSAIFVRFFQLACENESTPASEDKNGEAGPSPKDMLVQQLAVLLRQCNRAHPVTVGQQITHVLQKLPAAGESQVLKSVFTEFVGEACELLAVQEAEGEREQTANKKNTEEKKVPVFRALSHTSAAMRKLGVARVVSQVKAALLRTSELSPAERTGSVQDGAPKGSKLRSLILLLVQRLHDEDPAVLDEVLTGDNTFWESVFAQKVLNAAETAAVARVALLLLQAECSTGVREKDALFALAPDKSKTKDVGAGAVGSADRSKEEAGRNKRIIQLVYLLSGAMDEEGFEAADFRALRLQVKPLILLLQTREQAGGAERKNLSAFSPQEQPATLLVALRELLQFSEGIMQQQTQDTVGLSGSLLPPLLGIQAMVKNCVSCLKENDEKSAVEERPEELLDLLERCVLSTQCGVFLEDHKAIAKGFSQLLSYLANDHAGKNSEHVQKIVLRIALSFPKRFKTCLEQMVKNESSMQARKHIHAFAFRGGETARVRAHALLLLSRFAEQETAYALETIVSLLPLLGAESADVRRAAFQYLRATRQGGKVTTSETEPEAAALFGYNVQHWTVNKTSFGVTSTEKEQKKLIDKLLENQTAVEQDPAFLAETVRAFLEARSSGEKNTTSSLPLSIALLATALETSQRDAFPWTSLPRDAVLSSFKAKFHPIAVAKEQTVIADHSRTVAILCEKLLLRSTEAMTEGEREGQSPMSEAITFVAEQNCTFALDVEEETKMKQQVNAAEKLLTPAGVAVIAEALGRFVKEPRFDILLHWSVQLATTQKSTCSEKIRDRVQSSFFEAPCRVKDLQSVILQSLPRYKNAGSTQELTLAASLLQRKTQELCAVWKKEEEAIEQHLEEVCDLLQGVLPAFQELINEKSDQTPDLTSSLCNLLLSVLEHATFVGEESNQAGHLMMKLDGAQVNACNALQAVAKSSAQNSLQASSGTTGAMNTTSSSTKQTQNQHQREIIKVQPVSTTVFVHNLRAGTTLRKNRLQSLKQFLKNFTPCTVDPFLLAAAGATLRNCVAKQGRAAGMCFLYYFFQSLRHVPSASVEEIARDVLVHYANLAGEIGAAVEETANSEDELSEVDARREETTTPDNDPHATTFDLAAVLLPWLAAYGQTNGAERVRLATQVLHDFHFAHAQQKSDTTPALGQLAALLRDGVAEVGRLQYYQTALNYASTLAKQSRRKSSADEGSSSVDGGDEGRAAQGVLDNWKNKRDATETFFEYLFREEGKDRGSSLQNLQITAPELCVQLTARYLVQHQELGTASAESINRLVESVLLAESYLSTSGGGNGTTISAAEAGVSNYTPAPAPAHQQQTGGGANKKMKLLSPPVNKRRVLLLRPTQDVRKAVFANLIQSCTDATGLSMLPLYQALEHVLRNIAVSRSGSKTDLLYVTLTAVLETIPEMTWRYEAEEVEASTVVQNAEDKKSTTDAERQKGKKRKLEEDEQEADPDVVESLKRIVALVAQTCLASPENNEQATSSCTGNTPGSSQRNLLSRKALHDKAWQLLTKIHQSAPLFLASVCSAELLPKIPQQLHTETGGKALIPSRDLLLFVAGAAKQIPRKLLLPSLNGLVAPLLSCLRQNSERVAGSTVVTSGTATSSALDVVCLALSNFAASCGKYLTNFFSQLLEIYLSAENPQQFDALLKTWLQSLPFRALLPLFRDQVRNANSMETAPGEATTEAVRNSCKLAYLFQHLIAETKPDVVAPFATAIFDDVLAPLTDFFTSSAAGERNLEITAGIYAQFALRLELKQLTPFWDATLKTARNGASVLMADITEAPADGTRTGSGKQDASKANAVARRRAVAVFESLRALVHEAKDIVAVPFLRKVAKDVAHVLREAKPKRADAAISRTKKNPKRAKNADLTTDGASYDKTLVVSALEAVKVCLEAPAEPSFGTELLTELATPLLEWFDLLCTNHGHTYKRAGGTRTPCARLYELLQEQLQHQEGTRSTTSSTTPSAIKTTTCTEIMNASARSQAELPVELLLQQTVVALVHQLADETERKQVLLSLLHKTQEPSAGEAVKVALLKTVKAVWKKENCGVVTSLSDTLLFAVELLEDDSELVERHTKELLKLVQTITGEDVQALLKEKR
ncbi:unnamed protein product [Amoebophrya sp. A120]|nr:unnamed protein product [Amoebophrya sp. A120]|eukprot:GSA120T00017351001.1